MTWGKDPTPKPPHARPQPAPKALTGQDFWKANPRLAYQALQYLQQHSSNTGLSQQLSSNKQQLQQLTRAPVQGKNAGKIAQGLVHSQLGHLQQAGVDEGTARVQLLAELMQANAGRKDKIKAESQIGDPIEQLYKEGGDPTAEAIVKLGGTIADPYEQIMGKGGVKPKDAQSKLFSAVFARSPQGQQALLESLKGSPQNAAKLARVQMENQIVTQFSQIAGSGGVADQYDAYLADKAWRRTATTAEKRAAGPALPDPLTQLGYSRSSFSVPKGQPLTGGSIRAAMVANLEKERGSLRQLGKPGDPGFATGVPIPGTQVDKFIKELEKAGVVGKKLAQAMRSGGLSGQDAFVAYQELLQSGQMDPQLQSQMQQARESSKLPKLPSSAGSTAQPVA